MDREAGGGPWRIHDERARRARSLAFIGKHDDALAMGKKGVELNPSNAFGYWSLGLTHMLRGEPEMGIRAVETAIRISPNDVLLPLWLTTLSTDHYLARSYERSAEVARLAVQRAPHFPLGWRSLANALGHLGMLDEASEALAQFLTLMPSYTTEHAARASARFRDEPVFQHYLEGLRKAGWKG